MSLQPAAWSSLWAPHRRWRPLPSRCGAVPPPLPRSMQAGQMRRRPPTRSACGAATARQSPERRCCLGPHTKGACGWCRSTPPAQPTMSAGTSCALSARRTRRRPAARRRSASTRTSTTRASMSPGRWRASTMGTLWCARRPTRRRRWRRWPPPSHARRRRSAARRPSSGRQPTATASPGTPAWSCACNSEASASRSPRRWPPAPPSPCRPSSAGAAAPSSARRHFTAASAGRTSGACGAAWAPSALPPTGRPPRA
ncbi:hypothetical protein BU14_0419s0008 [Porphyra umbilicalis]|uniref:Uncharacterized protein n=1 Tax=Porphyra umbilicalis TaxID=2786 RepID=A0A1X6NVI9_PORUM|nr:hypothetical protein BU14_0419s0008 [Porphyra umbilicalis]|eukprot:OSX72602.1 hypothetical protein BU14_0419s0008 [Porphyra umbilicalis]